MSFKRLYSGSLVPTEKHEGDVPAQLDRPALLVYTGKFGSMDGEVDVKDEDVERLVATHNGMLAKFKRLASGETPIKYLPPIQLDHSTSAKDTVGRLVGDLTVGEHDDNGTKKKAVLGTVRVLGKENVEKILDGRWTHLSVGADFESGKLSELTITPFPAAEGASLLKRAELASGKLLRTVTVSKWELKIYLQTSGGYNWCATDKLGNTLESGGTVYRDSKDAESDAAQQIKDYEKTYPKKLSKLNLSKFAKMPVAGAKQDPMTHKWCPTIDGDEVFDDYGYASKDAAVKAAKEFIEIHKDEFGLSKGDPASKLAKKKHVPSVKQDPKTKEWIPLVDGEELGGRDGQPSANKDVAMGVAKQAAKELNEFEDEDLSKGDPMKEKMKKHLMEECKMSAEQADEAMKKMSAHLMETEKMSAEDADKKMSALSDDECKKMASDYMSRMAAEADKDKDKTKMSAPKSAKTRMSAIVTEMKAKAEGTRLKAAQLRIGAKLSRLRSDGKVTPAEIKKIDIESISKLSQDAQDAVFKTYEDREPVIYVGLRGSTKALDVTKLGKENLKTLEKQMRANMPLLRMQAEREMEELKAKDPVAYQKRLMEEQEGGVQPMADSTAIHIDTTPHVDMKSKLAAALKMLEEGKHAECLAHLKGMMDEGETKDLAEAPVSAETEAKMSALADEIVKLQGQCEELTKLVAEISEAKV